MKYGTLFAALVFGTAVSLAQQSVPAIPESGVLHQWNEQILEAGRTLTRSPASAQNDYQIGPEDLVEISVFEVPELSRTVRVSASGEISLPLLGALKVVGLSPIQLEHVLTDRLRGTYLQDPQVTAFLREYKSDPVSVVGAVKTPGLYHIQTRKTLVEVLAMAQGFSEGPLRQPGRTIVISRKPGTRWVAQENIPAEGTVSSPAPSAAAGTAKTDPESVEVPIKQLLQSGDPKWNVPIYPGDVIKVALAGTFYVAGDVTRPGGFPLTDFDNISAIQALAMGGGPAKTANIKNAVIIRTDSSGNRVEEKVNMKRVLEGKDRDVRLGENDVLFVPGSVSKQAAIRAIESSIQVATGILIWGR